MNEATLKAIENGATVVTGNNRLSRHLILQYGRIMAGKGLGAWPTPKVIPWNAFLQEQWRRARVQNADAAPQSLLNSRQARLLWERVIADTGAISVTASPAALSRLAQRSWRLMQQWQVSVPDLQKSAYSPDQKAFVVWVVAFTRELEKQQWITEEQLPAALANLSGDAGLPQELLFTGFDDFNPAQNVLFKSLRSAGCKLTIAEAPQRLEQCVRIAYRDDKEELQAAALWARDCVAENPEQSIAVLIPDLDKRSAMVRRVFMDVLVPDWRVAAGRHQLPVNFSYGQPLAENGVVSTALRILSLGCQAAEFGDVSMLLRSHYVKDAGQEEWGRATAEVSLRDAGIVDIWPRNLAVHVAESAPLFAGLLRNTPRWSGRQSAAAWSREFAGLLGDWGWPGAHLPETSEFRAYKAWTKLLDELAACDVVLPDITASKALGILRSMAQETLFQSEGNPDAIQVMGLLEASGQSFDRLRICGLTSDVWPASAQPDPLIPASLQRELNMPNATPDVTWRFNKAVMSATLNSAVAPVVSWPKSRNDELLYAAPLPVAVTDKSEEDANGIPAESGFTARIAEALQVEMLDDDVPPAVPAGEQVFGGSGLLAAQAACPARAFIEHRLGARELQQAVSGIDARTRGSMMHEVLENWYRRYPSQKALLSLSEDDQEQALNEIVSAVVERRYGSETGVLRAVAQQEVARLQRIAGEFLELEKTRAHFTVTGLEEKRKVIVGNNMELSVQLDRIDELDNGSSIVIDYKTSEVSASRWSPPRPLEPQLPLYAVTGGAQGIAIAAVSAKKISLKGVSDEDTGLKSIKPPEKHKSLDAVGWQEMVDQWRDSFDLLSAEFMGGDYRINPDDLAKARGEFGLVIRTAEFAGADLEESGADYDEGDGDE